MINFQLGKAGVTKNFIEALSKTFKKHELVKITILPSATRNRADVKKMARDLCDELRQREGKNFTARVVGFTIFIRKWRKLKLK